VVHIAHEAAKEYGVQLFSGAIDFSCHFWLPRPKHHYGKGGFLLPSAPYYHIIKPDTLKLARAVEDALTGVVWTDDSIIVREHLSKDYATRHNVAGALIEIKLLEEPQKLFDYKEPKNELPKRSYTLRDPGQQNLSPANR
jgi:Holliday junction resolvase RusA-like endonuclease